jgi:hypothetical protein
MNRDKTSIGRDQRMALPGLFVKSFKAACEHGSALKIAVLHKS